MEGWQRGDEAEVFDFVEDYLRDLESGAARSLGHYLERFPGHEEAIAREYVALREPATPPVAEHDPSAPDERRVGPYRLISELGRGGQGAVWLAEDTRIARRVALKVLPPSFAALSRDRRLRLRREAELVSRLDHPAICPVYEAQLEGELPYVAMRLVEGETLAARIQRAREGGGGEAEVLSVAPGSRLELNDLLRYFERTARALHAAHEAGVVHRDVKPGNLMVARRGEPVVLDFGQARDESAELSVLTRPGEVFGTPAYMAPEQIVGRDADRRADVWALGASLYEALSLERPFERASVPATLNAIHAHVPPAPSSHNGRLPRDLDVVVERALEKDPARRYPTALELAEDLRRVREYEPIHARPASPWLKLRRWARRHPAIAASITLVVLGLSGGLAWTLHMLAREREALDDAVGRHLATRAMALLDEDPSAALVLGIEGAERAPSYLTRSALFAALDACHMRSVLVASDGGRFYDMVQGPRSTLVAGAAHDGTVRIYDRESGTERARIEAHDGPVRALCMDPDGSHLVSGGDDGWLRVWSWPGGELVWETAEAGGPLRWIEFQPAGRRFSTAAAPGRWTLFQRDPEGYAREIGSGARPERSINCARIAPDGERIVTGSVAFAGPENKPGRHAAVHPLLGSGSPRDLGERTAALHWIELEPGGERAVTADEAGVVQLWSCATGEPSGEPLDLGDPVYCATFAPDGSRLAIALDSAQEPRALLWNPTTGERLPLIGHEYGRVTHAAFSPDGARLATCGADSTARIWDAVSGELLATLRARLSARRVAWSAGGERLFTLGNTNRIHVWYAAGLPDVRVLAGHAGAVHAGTFHPDGERVLTASADGTARLWRLEAEGAELVTVLAGHAGPLTGALFSPDGSRALTLSADGGARLWSAESGAPLAAPIQHGCEPSEAAFAPDGRRIATVARDGVARVFGADALDAPSVLESGVPVHSLRFTPDGTRLVAGCADGRARLYPSSGGAPLRVLGALAEERPPAPVAALALHPAGTEVALADTDGRLRFLALTDGGAARNPIRLFTPRWLRYDPQGTRLLAVGTAGGGALRIQELDPPRSVRIEIFHARMMTGGAFSPDGRLVLTTSRDGTAYVRDVESGQPVAHFALHAGPVLHGEFAPGPGAPRVITTSADGTARVWPVYPLEPARARKPRELGDWEVASEGRIAEPLRYP